MNIHLPTIFLKLGAMTHSHVILSIPYILLLRKTATCDPIRPRPGLALALAGADEWLGLPDHHRFAKQQRAAGLANGAMVLGMARGLLDGLGMGLLAWWHYECDDFWIIPENSLRKTHQ